MQKSTKVIGLVFSLLALCSCGIFSSNKNIPQGTRVSVLTTPDIETKISKASVLHTGSEPRLNASWAQTGFNVQHKMPNAKASSELKKKWKTGFGDGSSKRNLLVAQPIIKDGVVYAQDVDGVVSAFELETGQKIFKQKLKPLNKNDKQSGLNGGGLSLDGNKLFAVTGFGSVFALEPKTGNILWRKELNVPLRAAPTASDGKVFVQTIDNQIYALNSSDGSEIWDYGISAEDTVFAGGSVVAYDEKEEMAIAAFSNGEIAGFNSRIGYPVWSNNLINMTKMSRSSTINAVKAAPVIDQDMVFAVGNTDLTLAIDIKTGDILWQQNIGGINTPFVDKEYLFLIDSFKELVALDKKTGEVLWKTDILKDIDANDRREIYLSGPIMVNSELIVVSSNGMVYFVLPQNGEIVKEWDIDEDLPFAPIVAEGTIIFTTDDADLIAYK